MYLGLSADVISVKSTTNQAIQDNIAATLVHVKMDTGAAQNTTAQVNSLQNQSWRNV